MSDYRKNPKNNACLNILNNAYRENKQIGIIL